MFFRKSSEISLWRFSNKEQARFLESLCFHRGRYDSADQGFLFQLLPHSSEPNVQPSCSGWAHQCAVCVSTQLLTQFYVPTMFSSLFVPCLGIKKKKKFRWSHTCVGSKTRREELRGESSNVFPLCSLLPPSIALPRFTLFLTVCF